MDSRDWLFLLASIGHLALGLLAMSRAGKSPLGLPLTLLAFDFFGWTFATVGNHQFHGPLWRILDVVFTSLAPPVVLSLVLTFVGQRRARRSLLRVVNAAFGALAAGSALAYATPSGAAFVESPTWAALFLAGWIPTAVFAVALLARHLRSGVDPEEKARTRLVLAALLVGGVFASTDLFRDLGVPIPGLAPVGTLISTSLLAVVALRLRLFERNLGGTTALYAASVAAAGVLVYLTLFQGLHGNLPALTFGVTLVTVILGAIVREATSSLYSYRERVERLAVLGRFSAQMAHDLKNPLAALVGAVQVLDTDGLDQQRDGRAFRALIVEQAARIRCVVEKYERLGRVEPVRVLVPVNDLVKRVTALQGYASAHSVTLSLDLDPDVRDCDLDPDLLAGALENLVRNALEAMPNGGRVTVSTRRAIRDDGVGMLVLSVADTGEGMDARHAERAFDDFYTTKSTGSGLGLAFVRRVALAHGGDASLSSKPGAGTTVEIRVPGA